MAEVLASLKKIGGNGEQYTETSLWTNPSPTANFAGQIVELSDNISNYKYIAVKWKDSTSVDQVGEIVLDSANFMTQASSPNFYNFPAMVSSNQSYTRAVAYNSANKIQFGQCYRLGQTTTNNAYSVPTEILGINELAHGKIQTDYGLLPYSLTESVKVTLGYKPSYVEIKRYIDSTHWAVDTYDANLSSVKQLVGAINGSAKVATEYSVPSTTQNMIASIDDDGFTVTAFASSAITAYGTPYYRAIGS